MTGIVIECEGISKRYPHFLLDNIDLSVEEGSVMGFVGPNGAGKSTTIRIIMGLVVPDQGQVTVLGHAMPAEQIAAKRNIGFVSEDMRLYGSKSIGFHMEFIKSIFDSWDDSYAADLLKRFDLIRDQKVSGLSHGQRVKATLLLVLARRPALMVFDEPTTGLDPVARQEVVHEIMRAMEDETRSVLFSSHNTLEVEQISDHITFIRRGQIIDSRDKETFLDSWRRIRLEVSDNFAAPDWPGVVEVKHSGHLATLTISNFCDETVKRLVSTECKVSSIERMTLEEIFIAAVQSNRELVK